MKKSRKEVIKTYKEFKSIRKVAELTGYSKSGVEFILKIENVELFPRSRNGAENSASKSIQNLDPFDPRRLVRNPNVMRVLYVMERLSIPEIAKQLGVSKSTVITGLKQCHIKRRSKSAALKGKARPSVQGSKNTNWKGGITGWRKLSRGRLNEHFVSPVMKRDGFTCQKCGSKKKLVVHHHKRTFMQIVNLVKQTTDQNDLETFVAAIVNEHKLDDGITWCKVCHDNYHKEFGK